MGTKIIALDKERTLSTGEKQDLGLDASKTYALRFLYHTKLNQAADPKPFRINENFAETLAKKVIGMPWIVPPKIDVHLKSKNYEFANPTELLEFQTKYSIGKFVSTLKNEDTENYYGIVEIKPEFIDDFNAGRLLPSPNTSITLGNPKYSKEDGSIIDAEFLNLQTVKHPGYEPHLASIQGVCSAGLKQCVEELAVLGASGKEITSSLFSSISDKVVGAMSQETTQIMTPEQLTEAVQTLMKVVGEIKEKLDAQSGDSSDNAGPSVAGAAGKTTLQTSDIEDIKKMQKDFSDMKSQIKILTTENEKLHSEKRLSLAKSITDKLIKNNSIKEEDREETVKFYLDKKDDDGSLVDLSLVAETLDKVPEFTPQEKIVGASGFKLETREPQSKAETYSSVVSKLYKGGRN